MNRNLAGFIEEQKMKEPGLMVLYLPLKNDSYKSCCNKAQRLCHNADRLR